MERLDQHGKEYAHHHANNRSKVFVHIPISYEFCGSVVSEISAILIAPRPLPSPARKPRLSGIAVAPGWRLPT
jgi:hypothetical protein